MTLPVLECGNYERLKAGTHSAALAMAAACAAYNFAAWLARRQMHLAVNALLYSAAVVWEVVHIRHHLAARPTTQNRDWSRVGHHGATWIAELPLLVPSGDLQGAPDMTEGTTNGLRPPRLRPMLDVAQPSRQSQN